MYKIAPSVDYWETPDEWQDQVARAARLCYASKGGKRTSAEMCAMLERNNHKSMFRHGTAYFIAPQSACPKTYPWMWVALSNSPYVGIRYCKRRNQDGTKERLYFISTNMQYVMEHPWLMEALGAYRVTVGNFATRAMEEKFYPALALIRYTVCVTTQISTTRELNRVSPNNIAEQSTRYVNFFKKGGGITICLPHWYKEAQWYKKLAANISWRVGEWMYNTLLRFGLPPEDARTALPIDTASRVAYTYNVIEWRQIMNLRLLGTTGKPHPNAKIAAQLIHDAILPAMRFYGGEKSKLV